MFFKRSKKKNQPAGGGKNQTTYGVELLLKNGKILKRPGVSDLDEALRGIEGTHEAWITVSRGMADFITVTACLEGGFSLECEMGSRDNHQRINAPPLSLEQVLKMLVGYTCSRDESYHEGWDWQMVRISEIDLRKAPRVVHGDIWNDPEER